MSIVTKRVVRATISDRWCSFTTEATLEDVNGVPESESEAAHARCTTMSAMALDEFMKGPLAKQLGIDKKLPKNFDTRSVQQIVEDYKSTVGVKDNASPAEIMDKPLYVKPGKPAKK